MEAYGGGIGVQLHALFTSTLREILGFLREVEENCSLLGYNAACSSGISLPTFRYLSVPKHR